MPPNTGVAQGRGRQEQGEDKVPPPAMGICHPLQALSWVNPWEMDLHIPALGGSRASQGQTGCFTTSQKLDKMGN